MTDTKLFNKGFSTNRILADVPSLGRSILLRETTITELKSMCMTVIDNLALKQMDVIYDAATEYLQSMVLSDGIDINELTEFDRLFCMMVFFQMSFFKDPINFKCPHCGVDIVYRYDMGKYLYKMKDSYVEDQEVEIQNKSLTYRFKIGWPKVKEMSKMMYYFYNNLGQMTEELEQTQFGIHFLMSFIKEITVENSLGELMPITINDINGNPIEYGTVDLYSLVPEYQKRIELINSLPSTVVFDEKKGLFQYITGMFLNRLENCFSGEICPQCHKDTYYGLSQSSHFYGMFYGSLKSIYGYIKQIECLLLYRYDCFIFGAEQYITYNELNGLVKQIGNTAEKDNEERKKMGNNHLYKGLWMIREILNTVVFPEDKKH